MVGRLGSLTTLPTPPNTDPQTLNLFCHLRSIFPKACSHENVKPYQVAYSFLSWLLADIMRFWINEIERKRAFIAYSSYSSYFHMYIMIHHLWSAASILDRFYSANQFQNLKMYIVCTFIVHLHSILIRYYVDWIYWNQLGFAMPKVGRGLFVIAFPSKTSSRSNACFWQIVCCSKVTAIFYSIVCWYM